MVRYRLYYLRDSQLVGSDDIDARDDRAAARFARKLGRAERVEIWNAHEKVNVVMPPAGPGSPV